MGFPHSPGIQNSQGGALRAQPMMSAALTASAYWGHTVRHGNAAFLAHHYDSNSTPQPPSPVSSHRRPNANLPCREKQMCEALGHSLALPACGAAASCLAPPFEHVISPMRAVPTPRSAFAPKTIGKEAGQAVKVAFRSRTVETRKRTNANITRTHKSHRELAPR